MFEMLFVGACVVSLILILVFAAFPTQIIAGFAMFTAGVYSLVVHPQWRPIWLFCFCWATFFWLVAIGIHEDFVEREQRNTLLMSDPSPEDLVP